MRSVPCCGAVLTLVGSTFEGGRGAILSLGGEDMMMRWGGIQLSIAL
jgi:hypothetical protein